VWSSADLREVDWLAILVYGACLAVSLVVSEAVFHSYDDPVMED
jgi:hypothetical protein